MARTIPEIDDFNKILALKMLSAGFYIWLFCAAVSCIMFTLNYFLIASG